MDIKPPFLNFSDRIAERRLAEISAPDYIAWMSSLEDERAELRRSFSAAEYERNDLNWYRDAVVEHITFMYDTSFYEPGAGYKIDEFLDNGEREFGGYDIILLWHAYPRIGCDERNQFDFYRQMPGGLEGLRKVVDRCHERGVKAFIDYNPWDTGTRREGVSDNEALAQIIVALDADGIFLDTLSASNDDLRAVLDSVRPGVAFETEGAPSIEAAEVVTGSWGHFNPNLGPRFLWHRDFPFIANTHLTMKWLEPRHSTRVLERHSQDRAIELHPAIFNGLGTVVWENIFGWWNPWSSRDRATMRKTTSLLRNHRAAFQDSAWQPLIPTLDDYVMANEWTGGDQTVWTFVNLRFETTTSEVLAVPYGADARYYDAWNDYEEISIRTDGEMTFIPLTIAPRSAGCIVRLCGNSTPAGRSWTPAAETASRAETTEIPTGSGNRAIDSAAIQVASLEANLPKPVVKSELHRGADLPPEMVLIPPGEFTWRIEHRPREGACYDDQTHCWGNFHPDRTLAMPGFLMDRHPVTNNDYRRFVEATGYKPAEEMNFLAHWESSVASLGNGLPDADSPGGPPAVASPGAAFSANRGNHPVVYIDLDDARAYAAWAGKRLPTEPEWQYAATGDDGRVWPWGNQEPGLRGRADEDRCNSHTASTTPVDAFPLGVSPFGVWDMAGNAWEWTESERNDGHTRYVMLKGGSHYEAEGSRWYFDGGAQRCTVHAKFLLMWPGLDRCSTIGFRCVKDLK